MMKYVECIAAEARYVPTPRDTSVLFGALGNE